MPQDKHSSDDHAHTPEGRALKNFALMALPWLSFQRDILSIMLQGSSNSRFPDSANGNCKYGQMPATLLLAASGCWGAVSRNGSSAKAPSTLF